MMKARNEAKTFGDQRRLINCLVAEKQQ